MTERLLLVDDDAAFRRVYGGLLREAGYEVTEADDRGSADAAAAGHPVVLLDLMLPPDGSARGGLEQLQRLRAAHSNARIIVVSGAGDLPIMLEAVRAGAYDFLTKPVDPDVLLVVVQRAVEKVALERRIDALQNSLDHAAPEGTLLGRSPAFTAALDLAKRVAASDLPVLITGENGTGKELMARAVHDNSGRRAGPFVVVNCAGLPDTLLESSMFGHEKGAFTGAHRKRAGLFAEADGGTLFLDEVGDMPPALQVKLLRALESGEILPVGADRPQRVDVRIVSATNRDLDAMLLRQEFREDLYWRIKGAEVRLPALRERASDLPLLAAHFLSRHRSLSPDGRPKQLSDDALSVMVAHEWPGNLRELRHEMQRATVLAGDRMAIEPADLAFTASTRSSGPARTLQEKIEALERREIEIALSTHHNNRTHAAKALGLSRQGLLKKLARYDLG